jgi:hypothetical protein
VGDGKLEEYLEEFPAKEENVREAKRGKVMSRENHTGI